jgi:hypothetical protein
MNRVGRRLVSDLAGNLTEICRHGVTGTLPRKRARVKSSKVSIISIIRSAARWLRWT